MSGLLLFAASACGTPASTSPLLEGLRLDGRPGWIEEEPSSSMRVAQFTLPDDGAEGADAELVVYHFGESAGTVVQSPSGHYYVKLVGPAGPVAKWESSYRDFLDSLED